MLTIDDSHIRHYEAQKDSIEPRVKARYYTEVADAVIDQLEGVIRAALVGKAALWEAHAAAKYAHRAARMKGWA